MPLGKQFYKTIEEIMEAAAAAADSNKSERKDIRAVVLTGEGKAFSVRARVNRSALTSVNVPTCSEDPTQLSRIYRAQAGGDLEWLDARRSTPPQRNVDVMREFYGVRYATHDCCTRSTQIGPDQGPPFVPVLHPISPKIPTLEQQLNNINQMFLSVRRLPVPVVAAVNGAAIGAGLCLAMATDLVIAAKYVK